MKTIKTNLTYLLSAAIGVLTFVFFAIPYLSAYVNSVLGGASEGFSGYKVMDLWEGGFAGIMSSLLQILVLITAVFLLALGVCGLLKGFGILKAFPDAFGKLESKKLAQYGLYAYTGINALLLVFLIIFTTSNSDGNNLLSAGFSLSAGIFITLVFAIAASVTPFVVHKLAKSETSVETETETETQTAE